MLGRYEEYEKGNTTVLMTASLKFDLMRNSVMDYDGKRLAVATFLDIYRANSFYLTVFDRNGLAYCGKYEHRLDKGPFNDSNACKPVHREPLAVQWSGSFLTK